MRRAACFPASPSSSPTRPPACSARRSRAKTARSSPADWSPAPIRSRPSCRASRSSSARSCGSKSARPPASTSTMQVGGLEETVNVTAESPIVDLTSKEIGGNITSDTLVKLPSVNGNFIGFVGLLPGIVPSVSTESFGSDSICGQRPGSAQQQLHARRRQQQRRRDRAARRHAGAHADRGDPGVPGDHRPVRRAVRPHLGRGRQRRHQGRHQQLQGRGVRLPAECRA